MLRSAASKVMWVGRATVFLVGLAVILALVFGVASRAMGANGESLIIGNGLADTVKNIATLPTKLTMRGTAGGPALQVTQNSTNTNASGLGVTVPAGKAPIRVNSSAGKATNLDADKLDGKSAEQLSRVALMEHVVSGSPMSLGTNEATFGSPLSIDAPAAGFVRLHGNVTFSNNISSSTCVDNCVASASLLHANDTGGVYLNGTTALADLKGSKYEQVSVDGVFPVTAGVNNFEIRVSRSTPATSGTINVDRGVLTAEYTPYGATGGSTL
jgi:hypothetical protein